MVLSSARRKTARAKVLLREGRGRVFINGTPLELLEPEMIRLKIMEPIKLAGKIA
ncbi:MAG: 30S ribosomal protein S9, partial [Thermofilum sp.]|nr:30S ribosomal protein S9 [Thermofilum sp.]